MLGLGRLMERIRRLFGNGVGRDQRPKFTSDFKLDKDTTFLTEPLDAEGFVDYETALNERLRGDIGPETNVVAWLLEALGPKPEGKRLHPDFYKWLGTEPPAEKGEYYVPLQAEFRWEIAFNGLTGFGHRLTCRQNEPWAAADDPKFARWLRKNKGPLAQVEAAVKLAAFYLPVVGRSKDGVTGLTRSHGSNLNTAVRDLTAALAARANLRCGERAYAAAWQDVLTLYRLGRHYASGGFLIHDLVASAVEHIATCRALAVLELALPSAAQAERYGDDLRSLPPKPPLADIVAEGERFHGLDFLRVFRREGLRALTHSDKRRRKLPAAKREASVGKLDFEVLLRSVNATSDRAASALRLPTHGERVAAFVSLLADFPSPQDHEFTIPDRLEDVAALLEEKDAEKLRTTVTSAIEARLRCLGLVVSRYVHVLQDRMAQEHQNLLVAVALAGHFADTGQYPAKLDDLAPKYLAKVPDDLFSGKPLVYKPAKDGYLFYSVGVNGIDDGGKLLTDPVFNPADARGDDLGVRMPRLKLN